MRRIALIVVFILCSVLSACGYGYKDDGLYAEINSSMGKMIFMLYYDKVPITVGNFVGLADGTREFFDVVSNKKVIKPFYNGLTFHRIIKGFVIQGGCPMGDGRGDPGYKFVDEFVPELKHDSPGILSMANSGPNTNGSQFFITLAPTPHLNGRHTVFGKIVYGQDIIDKIANVKADKQGKPQDKVLIESIKIVSIGKNANDFDAEEAFAKNKEAKKDLEELQKQFLEDQEDNLKQFLTMLKVKHNRIVTTKTGLRYYVKKRGKGRKPKTGDIITAHYTGYLANGKQFDSSRKRGKPFETPIGVRRVIPGWDEAFLDMRKGEKRILIIPYNLAYGERGRPPVIPAKAMLIFDVELLGIKKGR